MVNDISHGDRNEDEVPSLALATALVIAAAPDPETLLTSDDVTLTNRRSLHGAPR
jgi:hypothetical protein